MKIPSSLEARVNEVVKDQRHCADVAISIE